MSRERCKESVVQPVCFFRRSCLPICVDTNTKAPGTIHRKPVSAVHSQEEFLRDGHSVTLLESSMCSLDDISLEISNTTVNSVSKHTTREGLRRKQHSRDAAQTQSMTPPHLTCGREMHQGQRTPSLVLPGRGAGAQCLLICTRRTILDQIYSDSDSYKSGRWCRLLFNCHITYVWRKLALRIFRGMCENAYLCTSFLLPFTPEHSPHRPPTKPSIAA